MPEYRRDIVDIIEDLSKRIERLERGSNDAGVGFVDLDGNVLFSVDGTTGKAGFFGSETAQLDTPTDLAGVINTLKAYGMVL